MDVFDLHQEAGRRPLGEARRGQVSQAVAARDRRPAGRGLRRETRVEGLPQGRQRGHAHLGPLRVRQERQ